MKVQTKFAKGLVNVVTLATLLFLNVTPALAQLGGLPSLPVTLTPEQSLTPISTASPCSSAQFSGWQCQNFRYGSTPYTLVVRYNLPDATPSEHVVWVPGGNGTVPVRNVAGASTIQNDIAELNQRSYDVAFTNTNGIHDPTLVGMPDKSAVLAAAVKYIEGNHAGGQKVKLMTGSYSTLQASYALAYHDLESVVDEVVMGSGPMGFNYKYEVNDPTHPAYLSPTDNLDGTPISAIIQMTNGWAAMPPCDITQACPEYDAVSIFTDGDVPFAEADVDYPGVEIHSILGGDDVDWFLASADYWTGLVDGAEVTNEVVYGVGHEVFGSAAVQALVMGYITDDSVDVTGDNDATDQGSVATGDTGVPLDQSAIGSGSGGFVPCSGASCSACDLVKLGNDILAWLIGLLFVIFAVMVALAGYGLATAGGNPQAKSEAKQKLTNAIVGIIVVLASWLLVDTIMRGLLSTGNTGVIDGYGPWADVRCGEQTATEDKPSAKIETPPDVVCEDDAALIAKYSGSPVGVRSPDLDAMIACYLADPKISGSINGVNLFTTDQDYPRCSLTNGTPVCSACSHQFDSCHYGRGSGQGAKAVDFNAGSVTEKELYDLLKARSATCGGRLLFEGNHTHISTDSC